jgi:hypothetical protein
MRLSRARRFAALALLALGAGPSCAEHIGRRASQGAIQGLKDNPPEQQPMRVGAQRAVTGALEAFDDPQLERRMRQLIGRSVQAAVAGTFDALDDPRQQERLRALVATIVQGAAREATREVVTGVGAGLDQMFPGCIGQGPEAEACRRQRLQALTRDAGAGFWTGVMDAVRWPLLAGALLLGLAVGVVAHWLWSLRTRPTPGRGPVQAGAMAINP